VAALQAHRAAYDEAIAVRRELKGARRKELSAVIRTTRDLAARGALTTSRMNAVFLTLRRNTEWWRARGVPAPGSPGESEARGRVCRPPLRARAARLSFTGSRLVFQYYPGHGLALQVNATWAAAQVLLDDPRPEAAEGLTALLAELLPLAADRGGMPAWEYLFAFQGGRPPWTSALSLGTAIKVLAGASQRLERPELLELARAAAGAFARPAPTGVGIALPGGGRWYALYSFAPRLRVLNAHLQATIGLHELATASEDPAADGLYQAGLAAAHARIGRFDTGRWSRYAFPGRDADLNYHVLNRNLARTLCLRSGDEAVCGAWNRFTSYLTRRCPRPATAARD